MRSKLLFLMLVVGLLCLAGSARADTLVFNPSFEIDTTPADGTPDRWGMWGSDWSPWFPADGSVETLVMNDPDGAHTGGAYFRGWVNEGGNYACAIPQGEGNTGRGLIPFTEGDVYYIGVWAKDNMPGGQPSPCGASIEVAYYDAGGNRDDLERHWITAEIPSDGNWHYFEGTTNKGINPIYPFMNAVPGTWTGEIQYPDGYPHGEADFSYDDMWVNTNPQGGLVYGFDPYDGEESISPSDTILSWVREDKCPGRNIKVEVWWGSQDDPNFWGEGSTNQPIKVMELADVDSFDLADSIGGPISLASDSVYYWKVMWEEPNACNWGNPELIEGPTLSFDTINRAPVADTGLNVDRWMAAGDGPVTIGIDASYDDDGLPEGGVVTYKWVSDPCTNIDILPHDHCQDPNVEISAPGDYTLTLTVNDGYLHPEGKTGDDFMVIRVFSNIDDRLSAH